MSADGYISLIWAGMSLGIIHDAGVKFSTPEVPRSKLLRVGTHLFRSYRRVETSLAAVQAMLEARRVLSGHNTDDGRGLNLPLMGALAVSLFHSHVFPVPCLLKGGDYVIGCEERGEPVDKQKVPWLKTAHRVVAVTETAKIGLLMWAAYIALTPKSG
mmetsp:Transcript_10553/g.25617  ORF Transcript_10553/g.25617 Transcript_10553/m.25617 type:complete len:158 (+) Transcript_10553:188-661(+)